MTDNKHFSLTEAAREAGALPHEFEYADVTQAMEAALRNVGLRLLLSDGSVRHLEPDASEVFQHYRQELQTARLAYTRAQEERDALARKYDKIESDYRGMQNDLDAMRKQWQSESARAEIAEDALRQLKADRDWYKRQHELAVEASGYRPGTTQHERKFADYLGDLKREADLWREQAPSYSVLANYIRGMRRTWFCWLHRDAPPEV